MPDLVVTVDSATKQLPESVRTKLAADLPPGISSWDDLEDKPPVIAAGPDAATARTEIGVDAATTSMAGLVELATTGETTTGTVTPAGLKSAIDEAVAAAISEYAAAPWVVPATVIFDTPEDLPTGPRPDGSIVYTRSNG